MPHDFDDGKYVLETIKNWDKRPDDVNFEIERIQYAIKRNLKRVQTMRMQRLLSCCTTISQTKSFGCRWMRS